MEEENRKRSLLKIPKDLKILVSILVKRNLKSSLMPKFIPKYFMETDVSINELL